MTTKAHAIAYARAMLESLTPSQGRVLLLLARLADEGYAVDMSKTELARRARMPRPTVKDALKALTAMGIIVRQRQSQQHYGDVANRYVFQALADASPIRQASQHAMGHGSRRRAASE